MANIVFSFTDNVGTVSAQYDMSQADMDRMMTAFRSIYLADDGTINTKNGARKQMARYAVKSWKDSTRAFETEKAANAVPDIPLTET